MLRVDHKYIRTEFCMCASGKAHIPDMDVMVAHSHVHRFTHRCRHVGDLFCCVCKRKRERWHEIGLFAMDER